MTGQPADPIAIVGSGCRFPGGSNSPSSLWKLLHEPRDVLKEIPKERFDLTAYYHPDGAHHGTTNVRHSYTLDEDIRLFDAHFFNINPMEADSIDPQQRVLMETIYESLESAGLTIERLQGSDTAIYVGVMAVDYQDVLMRDMNGLPTYFATGISRSIVSNRISYFFDWHGPSMTIDTACSSSMIAVHQAVQALRSGESRLAVAAGTELILTPGNYIAESKMNLLSPTGRSRMWDVDADGYARGDGVAAVVMKKLSNALEDNDHIECIIRETGINQDGRTSGLTVPSSEAQASLIKQTYLKAGLDITNPRDRPQFFEAHGTGTKVGDPREAAAIKEAFFGVHPDDVPLNVGSIKTVIGHTEGTAGLAGLLKGSLALQHGIIPPNMLFNTLNPSIEPYYNCLQVPTKAKSWPHVPEGCPRRVSVNSFGFGGTNAHVILESYQSRNTTDLPDLELTPFTPFTFSAVSERSLVALLQAYSDYLKREPVNLRDLAWTLQSHRSAFPFRTTFSGTSVERLVSKIDEKLVGAQKDAGALVGVRSSPCQARILGVFTGQGAQWATMGGELIRSSTFVRDRFKHLEDSLASLPESDRPSWTLREEILASASSSRIAVAEFSQPLCTAIQIILVDILRSAGITFAAVVGHSSGEIAAAYAADLISAHDAIRIAYYRGLYAKLAGGARGQKGAMLAVGTSWEDATELCELPMFEGRITVAAHNSSANVTISGDIDAVAQAKNVFEEEKKFARTLKVDTAYHSHHMLPCSDPYIKSLRGCRIKINYERDGACSWFSSVTAGKVMEPVEELQDTYWRDNMVNPVAFTAAVTNATKIDVNLALEIGPHPALKGPTTQIISDVLGAPLPYCGVLRRDSDDNEAFSDGLGFIWAQMSGSAVDFQSFDRLISAAAPPKFLKGLPLYQWDHGRIHWYEARISKNISARPDPFHELLGVRSPDGTDREMRWANILKTTEIPWLDGHQLQGQTVFPAAGYVTMALEAGRSLAEEREVQLFEVHDLVIERAITFEEDDNHGVETLVTLTGVTPSRQNQETREADFSCYSSSNADSGGMALAASGRVKLIFGKASTLTLPSTQPEASNMVAIDTTRFYSTLLDLGYGYTGPFRGMSSLKRKLNNSTALVSTYSYEDQSDVMIVHPTMLDVAFQASLLAQSTPGDQRLWSLHVPTSIKCIRVDSHLCSSLPPSGTQLPIHAVLGEPNSVSICGDVDICSEDGQRTIIKVEGLTLVPFSPATMADDRHLFSYTHWDVAAPNGTVIMGDDHASAEELELASLSERLAYYYLRKWEAEINADEWARGEWYYQRLQDSMKHLLSVIETGRHPYVNKEWASDSLEHIRNLSRKYPNCIDLKLITAVGENIPAAVRGETTILEHMLKDNMLDDLYKQGIGFKRFNSYLAKMVRQIAHRFPRMKILEIGAGTGGATKSVLESLGNTFSFYTYTDISTGFFEKASELFRMYAHKMAFKVFDVEKTPASQGYEENSYDLIIASNVLHATKSLHKTLDHTRRLLKPGGYLLLLEITNNGPIRIGSMTGGLPGWWVGADDGRQFAPTVSAATWNNVLRKSGFSGVDARTPDRDSLAWPFSILAAQATDERVNFLRKPLSLSSRSTNIEELVILGSKSIETSRIAEDVADFIGKHCGKVTVIDSLPTHADNIAPMSTFLNLIDLDQPIFKSLTTESMGGLKRLFELSRNLLWITRDCRADEPYHMSSVGFGRSISHEMPHMRLQFLDLENLEVNVSRVIAETLLRLHATEEWGREENLRTRLLWTTEPEIVLENDRILVPRVLTNGNQNARLNSWRRTVTKDVSPQTSIVRISQSKDGFVLRDEPLQISPEIGHNFVNVNYSVLSALRVASETFMFVNIGTSKQLGHLVVGLSEANASVVACRGTCVLPDVSPNEPNKVLSAVSGELLARCLIAEIPATSIVLVHEPHHALAAAMMRRAAAKGIQITFSTTDIQTRDPAWVVFHPFDSERIVKRKLPKGLSHFFNLAVEGNTSDVVTRIIMSLPRTCKRNDASAMFRDQASMQRNYEGDLSEVLLDAVTQAQANNFLNTSIPVPLGLLSNTATLKAPMAVIDWTADATVTVKVQPSSPDCRFSRDKTYLLVGLTGQIGQSLCEWMTRNGAGCICLLSRNPNIENEWLESFVYTGTTVKIFSLDITDKQDLTRVCNEIQDTLPPIAGVANGAMILHDTLFTEMSLEMMEKVLKPKVDGSNNLNEIFYDIDLDFFVLFSSLSSVVGNTGQSNYAAASTYLTSLATQRRQRGFAASAFDIGWVVGIGYVERAGQLVQDQLVKYGYMPISESDFHQMFAETIQAGRPNSEENPVVTTGIRAVRDDEEVKVPWFDNPRFSHFILEAGLDDIKKEGKRTTRHITDQLMNVSTKDEALDIVRECFSVKLQLILQLSAEEVDHGVPLVELGVDSLVAVEVRSWFLKELKVDVPVLKVLGGSSVTDLCQQTLEKIPEKLVPNIVAKDSTKLTEPTTKPQGPTILPEKNAPPIDGIKGVSNETFVKPDDFETKVTPIKQKFAKIEKISFAQSRFWFLRHLVEDQTTFNVSFYYRVSGQLRIGDLAQAIKVVGQRHEGLRTCFLTDDNEVDLAHQGVLESSHLTLEQKKISNLEELAAEYEALKSHLFDLEHGKLMRVILLSLSTASHYLLFAYHHILMDGVSFQVFLSDLEKAYRGVPLGPKPRQFPDYTSSQIKSFESGNMNKELRFWRGVFPDAPPVLPLLPMAHVSSRMPMKTFAVNQVEYWLDPSLVARIKQTSMKQRSTTFHFYLATFKAMLFRFLAIDDLTIGIADANRTDENMMGTIGLFLNLLALRFQYHPNQRFADSIVEARTKAYTALENSQVPFDVLLKELNVPRSSAYSPIFQAFFDYRQGAKPKQAFGDCHFEIEEVHPGRTAYDITLDVTDSPSGTLIIFRTQKSLYGMEGTNLLMTTYRNVLEVFSSNVSLSLQEAPLFSQKQVSNAIGQGRGPDMQTEWPETLPHRVDQIAQGRGDAVAVKDGLGRVLPYSEMMDRIEAIAEALQKECVGVGSRIAVFQQATSDWICSLLAIMRIGAIYVPFDLRNPLPRLAAIAGNCQPHTILADGSTVSDTPELHCPYANIINVSLIARKPSARIGNSARADSPAAILYTSGSTGMPKGIIIKHSSLRNEMEGYTKTWKLGAERVLQQSAFTFNHSTDQIFTGLVNGGMVYIVPWSKRGDPLEITKLILNEKITYTKATPSEYLLWLQYGSSNLKQAFHWQSAFGGGETLTKTLMEGFRSLNLPRLRFFNSYGPAEITISSTKMEIPYHQDLPDERIPCGYSLPNYVAYILDNQLKPVPVGLPGEIVIGGAGVSLGYLHNKELTEQNFIPNPYATPEYIAQGWNTMYRTGDIGRLGSDGALIFDSRIIGDTQIKIRGIRIELGDIESNIIRASRGTLREAIVTLRGSDPEFLIAHVVFAPHNPVPDEEDFLRKLLAHLPIPQYMIPVMAIPLDRLPLSNHSKVDRKAIEALPLPERTETSTELTEIMDQLKYLWEDVLCNKKLGLQMTPATSFFQVGGNSLLIVRLQSRIRDTFHIVVRLVELLGANTLGEMAQKIEESMAIDLIDWETEIELPDISSLRPVEPPPSQGDKKVVLLTGSTGFLAKSILAQLVKDPRIAQIHCVAIRSKPLENRKPAISSDKIATYAGDLSQPWLGLSETDFWTLSRHVDVILHSGAMHQFWDNYHILRATNVLSTKQLIKLAAPRRIPIHYTSSAGVVPSGADIHTIASVAAHAPPIDGSDGYVASRWASERCLEKASATLDIPVSIHRFTPAKNELKRSTAPVMGEFVRFAHQLRLMPEFGGWKGHFDMTSTETAAGALCKALLNHGPVEGEKLRFSHHECEFSMTVLEMREFMEGNVGTAVYERLPVLQWVGKVKPAGFGYFFASQHVTMERTTEGGIEELESRR